MPFIRYSRDRRGYESTVVLHAYRAGQGPPRTRILYMFRSPSNIKVGRHGLDPEVMEALEHTHPDLAFDWVGLLREPAVRVDRERPDRWRGRDDKWSPGPSGARPPAGQPRVPVEPVPPVIIVDESLLGRTLGAQEAARLRARSNEVLQRIARRAPTPEERDRLTDRAVRLNPDDWPDDAAIRASVATAQAEWEAILAELPQRRRGRRGGRNRPSGPPASAIIESEGQIHERPEQVFDASVADEGSDAGDPGDRGGLGADAEPAATDAASDAPGGNSSVPGVGDSHHD